MPKLTKYEHLVLPRLNFFAVPLSENMSANMFPILSHEQNEKYDITTFNDHLISAFRILAETTKSSTVVLYELLGLVVLLVPGTDLAAKNDTVAVDIPDSFN